MRLIFYSLFCWISPSVQPPCPIITVSATERFQFYEKSLVIGHLKLMQLLEYSKGEGLICIVVLYNMVYNEEAKSAFFQRKAEVTFVAAESLFVFHKSFYF